MIVSSRGRYAIRVMIDLAQHNNGELISLKEIAQRQEISMKYLELIVRTLNKGGMLVSGRGKKGGYRLKKSPEEYSISEILKLTEKTLAPVNCGMIGEEGCERAAKCITLPMWKKLDAIIDEYLSGVTLKDLLEGNV
ncbi:MAG: Rrf2 family transcriptional regulator [Eubacteriales bacterium]|nr:Rrf2 family transcriptional regulator [Eubacteriales bacterium]